VQCSSSSTAPEIAVVEEGVAVAAVVTAVVAAVVAVVRQRWEQEQGKCTKACGRLGRVVRWGGCSVRVAAREAVA
jgi:hypothetical protein